MKMQAAELERIMIVESGIIPQLQRIRSYLWELGYDSSIRNGVRVHYVMAGRLGMTPAVLNTSKPRVG